MKRAVILILGICLVLVVGLSAVAAAGAAGPRPHTPAQFLAGAIGLAVGVGLASIILAAFLTLVAFLLPGKVQGAARICTASPGLTFFVGLVNGGVALGLLALTKAVEPLAGPAKTIIMVMLVALVFIILAGAIVGLAASITRLGDGVARMWGRGGGASDLARLLMGCACAVLAACVVYVGWVFLGYLALQGLGGIVLSFFRAPAQADAPAS